jgi:adenosylmethionine-8-amino-7-oxononanoate aminotransferase
VITGFGRTGTMFGLQHWDVQPDMMAFAKGITSGYLPLGGVQISDAIYDAIMSAPPAETWMHGFTYSGHATSCAVGLKNLEIIERQRLVENSQKMGERLLKGLQTLLEFPNVGNVRGLGLIAGVEIVKSKESKEQDAALALKVADACLARNLRVRPLGNVLAMSPGLCIDEEEVDLIVSTLGAALDSV